MELFHAAKQYSSRPKDQTFDSAQQLYDVCKAYASTAKRVNDVPLNSIRAIVVDGDVQITRGNRPARLTHWSFGQLSARAEVPTEYARTLPATLAVQNINHGLAKRAAADDGAKGSLLLHNGDDLLLRAINGSQYEQIWNWEVAERLIGLESLGWSPARPDIRKGENDHAAMYASDHDLFAFMRSNSARIKEAGNPDGLQRGVIVVNSEVGASALWLLRFLYREMCGNHIIWGAEQVMSASVRHVGNARERWQGYEAELSAYLESSAAGEEAKIQHLQTVKIGTTKEEVLDRLFGVRSLQLSRKALTAGYEACLPDVDGSPLTPWGIVQGLTRHSQTLAYADARTTIDRAAGKVLDLGF